MQTEIERSINDKPSCWESSGSAEPDDDSGLSKLHERTQTGTLSHASVIKQTPSQSSVPPTQDTETDSDHVSQCPRTLDHISDSKESKSRTATKSTHKLGKIGSRNKKPIKLAEDEGFSTKNPTTVDMYDAHASSAKKARHKLGKIGDKFKGTSSGEKPKNAQDNISSDFEESKQLCDDNLACVQMDSSQPPQPLQNVTSDQALPAKMSEMQANKNRERLKRELEMKSNTINKKKRKF